MPVRPYSLGLVVDDGVLVDAEVGGEAHAVSSRHDAQHMLHTPSTEQKF